jgi:predicted acetyltransferase
LPTYIDNIQSLLPDEILIFKSILDKSNKIFYIKDIVIPMEQNCIINDILISIMKNCIDNGGIISFLNEIKALYEKNIIHPFTKIEKFCFDYSADHSINRWPKYHCKIGFNRSQPLYGSVYDANGRVTDLFCGDDVFS